MSKTETTIVCRVENGGIISNRKGINVPGTKLSMPFISERDRSDIIFGIEEGFDCIAASFTRDADDILAVRKILDEHNCHSINIIAKIENAEGVENIDPDPSRGGRHYGGSRRHGGGNSPGGRADSAKEAD